VTDSRRIDRRKIKPASVVDEGDYRVAVPPTVLDQDTPRNSNDDARLRKQRADFRPDYFKQAIDQKGRHVVWRKALVCPCFNPTTNQTEINCEDCDGSGYVYVDPLRIQAWTTNFDQNLSIYKHAGSWLAGEGSATTYPEHRCGYRDSLELVNDLMPFNELLKRGNRRGIRSKLPDGVDSARYRIKQIVRIGYKNAEGRVALAEEDVHFRLTKEGWIEWLPASNAIIADESYFSILYNFAPVYIVNSHANVTRNEMNIFAQPKNTLTALPTRVLIKLDYLTDVNAPVTGPLGEPTST
jgi:hypothetical protein